MQSPSSILLPSWRRSRGGSSARSLIHTGTLRITWRVCMLNKHLNWVRGNKKDKGRKSVRKGVRKVHVQVVLWEGIEMVMEGATGIRKGSIQPLCLQYGRSICHVTKHTSFLSVKQWCIVWYIGDFSEQTFNNQFVGKLLAKCLLKQD